MVLALISRLWVLSTVGLGCHMFSSFKAKGLLRLSYTANLKYDLWLPLWDTDYVWPPSDSQLKCRGLGFRMLQLGPSIVPWSGDTIGPIHITTPCLYQHTVLQGESGCKCRKCPVWAENPRSDAVRMNVHRLLRNNKNTDWEWHDWGKSERSALLTETWRLRQEAHGHNSDLPSSFSVTKGTVQMWYMQKKNDAWWLKGECLYVCVLRVW